MQENANTATANKVARAGAQQPRLSADEGHHASNHCNQADLVTVDQACV